MSDEENVSFELYIPPQLGKNNPDKEGNDAPIRPGAERYSKNIFFYWHQFFRAYWDWHKKAEGPDAALLRKVKKDFKGALDEGFEAWWRGSGSALFTSQSEEVSTPVTISSIRNLRAFKNGMFVFLPFDGDFPAMMKDIRPKFEEAVEDHYLRKPRKNRKYKLHTNHYKLTGIRNQLIVYNAVMSDLAVKGPARPTPYSRIFNSIDTSLSLDDEWELWGPTEKTAFVSKNFRKGCRLAYHVARGEFLNSMNHMMVTSHLVTETGMSIICAKRRLTTRIEAETQVGFVPNQSCHTIIVMASNPRCDRPCSVQSSVSAVEQRAGAFGCCRALKPRCFVPGQTIWHGFYDQVSEIKR